MAKRISRIRIPAVAGVFLCATSSFVSVASAQTHPQADEANGRPGVEDIIVTAQRRSQRQQDVPISLSVADQRVIANFAIKDTLDLQKAIPGVIVQERSLNSTPYIRGIGSDSSAAGDESPIGVYVDGVYRASAASGTFSLPNIERIEVLKGPQGTLFGRNATGGVINVVTKQPSEELGGTLSAGYANFNTVSGNVYLTGGLAPGLAGSISGQFSKRGDGWGKNVNTGKDIYTRSDRSVAATLRLDLDGTTFTLNGDWSRNVYDGGPGNPMATLPNEGSAINGVTYYAGFYNINADFEPRLSLENYGVSLRAEHEFDWATLISITAWRKTEGTLQGDSDATPVSPSAPPPPTPGGSFAGLSNFIGTVNDDQFTQELQLQSAASSRVNWILGFFFLDARSKNDVLLFVPGARSYGFNDMPTRSYAIFGQATLPVSETTNLTLGARYTIDRKGQSGNPFYVLGTTPRFVELPSATFKKPTWRIALDHKFMPNVMGYASYSRGFKSGVFGANAFAPPVRPQTVDAFELGFKSELFDRRLMFNVAAFHSKFKNIQIGTTVTSGGSSFVRVLNAAGARINGIEVDLTAIPVDNLRLSGSLSLLDGKYTDFKNAPVWTRSPTGFGEIRSVGDRTGFRTNGTPKVSFTVSAEYTVETGAGALRFNLNDNYIGDYFITADHLNKIESRHLVGASVDLTTQDDRFNIRLWSNNLFDKKWVQFVSPRASGGLFSPGDPRTYGVTLSTKF